MKLSKKNVFFVHEQSPMFGICLGIKLDFINDFHRDKITRQYNEVAEKYFLQSKFKSIEIRYKFRQRGGYKGQLWTIYSL